MKMRGVKALLWFLNLVLLAGIGMTAWMFVTADPSAANTGVAKLDEDLSSVEKLVDQRYDKKVETIRRQSDLNSLWKSNLRDNAPEPPAAAVTAEKTPEDTAPKKQNPLESYLSVSGIFGQVVLVNLKKKIGQFAPGHLDVLMGEPIEGMRPETKPIRYEREPFPGAVVFSYGDKEVKLELDEAKGLAGTASDSGTRGATGAKGLAGRNFGTKGRNRFQPAGTVNASGRTPTNLNAAANRNQVLTEAKEIQPGLWRVPRSEFEMVKEKGQDLLKSVDVSDYSYGGNKTGLKINFIEQNSFVGDRGFKKGDVVIKVNGYPVKSQSDLMQWVSANEKRLQNSVAVTVLRQGQEKTIKYQIQK